MSLREAWDEEAENWVKWARAPGHDSYWAFHRDVFKRLLPPPAGRALDVGCGEGRLPRDMKSWGYNVAGVDGSETMIRYAREADPRGDYRVADAASLPFDDGTFDLVTALMSLHDIDDFDGALREIARPGSASSSTVSSRYRISALRLPIDGVACRCFWTCAL